MDAYAPTADVPAEMWDLPFETESVDEIYSAHALEHVSIRQVQPTVKEWFRVLKPGGRLVVAKRFDSRRNVFDSGTPLRSVPDLPAPDYV